MKEDYDGAEPSASSVSVMNLLVLSHLVDDPALGRSDRADVAAVRARLEQMGRGVPMMARGAVDLSRRTPADRHRRRPVAGDARVGRRRLSARTRDGRRYLPFAIQLRLASGRHRRRVLVWAGSCRLSRPWSPSAAGRPPTSAANQTCRAPVDDRARNSRERSRHEHSSRHLAARHRLRDDGERSRAVTRAPTAWTDDDVRFVLEGMLRAMDRSRSSPARTIAADRAARPQLDREPLRRGRRRDRDRDHARRRDRRARSTSTRRRSRR